MGKITLLPVANAVDGTEMVPVVQGPAGNRRTKQMSPALFGQAANRPTAAELAAAVFATLLEGNNIDLADNGDGTATIALKVSPILEGMPQAPTAEPGTDSNQIATTAFVHASTVVLQQSVAAVQAGLASKQARLVQGANVDLVDNPDGTVTVSATGGPGIPANTYALLAGSTFTGKLTAKAPDAGGAGLNVGYGAAPSAANQANGDIWATAGGLYFRVNNAQFQVVTTGTLNGYVPNSSLGANNGVATLDAGGKVPAAQLPSYIDDVLEFANAAAFPNPGETGKIYVAQDSGRQSRWTGTAYVELTASPGTTDNVPEGALNRYFTDARVRGAVATGLTDIAGTPAPADGMITILGKIRKALYTDLATTIRGTVATGLAETAGVPAAADSILTVLGKLWKKAFTDIPASIAAGRLLPNTDQAASFNVGNTDTEKSYRYTGAGGHTATILDTLAVGAIVTIYHDGTGGTLTIGQGAGVTLVNVGSGATGNFTIPQMSSCVVHKIAAGRILASPSR